MARPCRGSTEESKSRPPTILQGCIISCIYVAVPQQMPLGYKRSHGRLKTRGSITLAALLSPVPGRDVQKRGVLDIGRLPEVSAASFAQLSGSIALGRRFFSRTLPDHLWWGLRL